MTIEEHISAFMDRALTPAEEAELMHTLSVSPEKLAMFHEYLGTRAAFVADLQTAAVPAHLDAAVLGILPAAAPPPTAGTAALVWTWRRGLAVLVAAVGFFTAGLMTHSWLDAAGQPQPPALAGGVHDGGSPGAESGASMTRQTTAPMEPASDAAVQPGADRRVRTTAAGDADDAMPMTQRVVRRDAVPVRDTIRMAGATVTIRDTVRQWYRDTLYVALPAAERVQAVADPIAIAAPHRPPTWSFLDRIDLEVQNEHLNTYPYINTRRIGADRAQQNMAVLAAYNLDEHHALGIMAGRKAFAQEFYTIASDSIHLYQQQPLMTYGGGFYRYSLPLLRGVTPQIMLQIGGCDLGPIFGSRIGVTLTPFEPVSIIVGVNASLLAYRFNGNLFTSHTLGFLYGINIAF